MAEDPIAKFVSVRLAEKRWRQADLVRASGVDKNTISTFMTGKSKPSPVTLAKIETALGLTPGTLADIGEEDEKETRRAARIAEVQRLDDPLLREASDEQLLAELGWRLVQLRRNATPPPPVPHPIPAIYPGDPDDIEVYEEWTRLVADGLPSEEALTEAKSRIEAERAHTDTGSEVDAVRSVTELDRPVDVLQQRAARKNRRASKDHPAGGESM